MLVPGGPAAGSIVTVPRGLAGAAAGTASASAAAARHAEAACPRTSDIRPPRIVADGPVVIEAERARAGYRRAVNRMARRICAERWPASPG
jgi:hypothetical protein